MEIEEVLPNLTNAELQQVEATIQRQYRDRKMGILYDDSYGVWTEEDQNSAAAEVFATFDEKEEASGRS